MSKFLFRVWFATLPLVTGVFLPYIYIYKVGRCINLFWSMIYGLGLILSESVFHGAKRQASLALGGVLWPILLSCLLFWLSGRLWQHTNSPGRRLSAGLLLLTGFLAVGLGRSNQAPFDSIPTYWKLMFVLW
jgi:hypothetical protein